MIVESDLGFAKDYENDIWNIVYLNSYDDDDFSVVHTGLKSVEECKQWIKDYFDKIDSE